MNFWCEWSDFKVPSGVTLHHPLNFPLETSNLDEIEFYVPTYMSGASGFAPIAGMRNLRVLQLPNAGYDDALEYWRSGMTICNAAGVHSTSTAELAVGLAIAAQRNFFDFAKAQVEARWSHRRERSLADSRIAIVGYGDIGKEIQARLAAFEVSITAYSKSGRAGSKSITELDADLPLYDIVILIVPLSDETRGIFDARRLALMKTGALLINVARGPIVDTDALLRELESGRLRAALDVTDPEPLPADHPLWRAPNVFITPHVGGDTSAFKPRFQALLADQLNRYLSGQPLRNIVKS